MQAGIRKAGYRAIAVIAAVTIGLALPGGGAHGEEQVSSAASRGFFSKWMKTERVEELLRERKAKAKPSVAIAAVETEYWRYQAGGKLNKPLPLSDGKLFATTENGLIAILDPNGKAVFSKNQYTGLTAPVMNGKGDIWITGGSARLYRYDGKGNGEMAGIYYFQKKTENLMPSAAVADGEGRPYFSYQHAILSLDAKGAKEMYVLPEGVSVRAMAPAGKGVYALASNGTLYAVHGSKLLWQAELPAALRKGMPAADGTGGLVIAAGKALAGYEADGTVRFTRELSAAPAGGGWSSPVVFPGDDGSIIAAELGGNDVVSFRLRDGAERWRLSASGAGGFGPAALALAPEGAEGGQVLAAARSGAVIAIDAAGRIAYTYKHAAVSAAGGVAALGGGRIAFASADVLVAAGPYRPVAVTYAAASGTLKLPLGTRLLLADKLTLSAPVAVSYRSDNGNVVRVSPESVVTPVAAGKASLIVDVTTPGYKGQLKLPVEITASSSKLKATHASQKIKLSNGTTYTVQTVTIPRGMPVTLGIAKRSVGASQSLADIAKAYGADAAVNGTYFSAYEGLPEPYGMMMSDGELDFIGNTGTTIGFTWDGTVLMDNLRAKIVGGTNGSFSHPNNWYAYFVNRTPTKGASSAVMFTPKRGAKLGFAYGTAITVRGGIVTLKSSNQNAAIPADGYVLVFTGAEEKLADRFKVGDKVDYKLETKNLGGQLIDWSRVHTAVGAGPRLVKDGKLAVNAKAEGFTEAKILTNAAARSGILVKKDGTVVIATVPAATMNQWGEIMLKLGAHQAMNLDGGASSGLYAGGKLITTPGRLISNALVFGNHLKW
ncbi:phosphodiester glycosidase family protein [Paenibacillus soyae]|uniref:Phosphodiester glycosidase family protein n=1 Tax=Paenibacillus soyae TaxID=2969249 RepID=A0A9X2SBJ9_9BACL|nr:phosphodiester glycosidase family protein [Paenibacillus soyae]MCR2807739.1 phosphodiester glycosidase family protein [Paenibacillus soyae]